MKFLLFTSKLFCVVISFVGLANQAQASFFVGGYDSPTNFAYSSGNLYRSQYGSRYSTSQQPQKVNIPQQSAAPQQNTFSQSRNTNQFANQQQNSNTNFNNYYPTSNQIRVSQPTYKLPDFDLPYKPVDLSSLDDFLDRFRKSYSSQSERTYRQYIFRQNQAKINQNNQDPNRSFNMAVNKFADLTADQFQKIYTNSLPYNGKRPRTGVKNEPLIIDSPKAPPNNQGAIFSTGSPNQGTAGLVKNSQYDFSNYGRFLQTFNIDWKGQSGPVKDQGFCGCCYAFTANDNIAALERIRNPSKAFRGLSIQQIIDCSTLDTYGCNGGYIDAVLDYIVFNGINYESDYRFTSGITGRQGGCKKKASPNFKIKNYFGIQPGSCSSIIQKLKEGPVSVGIAGYQLQLYEKGIFQKCQYNYVNHAVLLVGYKSSEYWVIKNGWGTDWGEQGYARIAPGNTCQICQDAWYPQLL